MDLKVGVIGTGAIGQDHIKRITTKLKGVRVMAVSDVNTETAKQVAKKYDAVFFENGKDLIASDEVQAVLIASIDTTHEEYIIEALKYGKYVFCEKPLSNKADSSKRIVDAEIRGGKKLIQLGYMRRYDAGYRQLKDVIASRKLGEPLMVHCAHRNMNLPESYTTPMSIENTAVHEIDVLRWILGEDYVSAQVLMPKKSRNSHSRLHDPQIVILKTTSGIYIDIELFATCQYGYEIKCEICCENGTASLPEPSYPAIRANGTNAFRIPADWKERFADAYDVELQHWIDAVNEGRVDGPTAWDGYVVSRITEACSKAREKGDIIRIDMEAYPQFYSL